MAKFEEQLTQQIPRVQELFRKLSDFLFSSSHELAKSGGANWDRAEALFKLAKSADQLRNSVVSILSAEGTNAPRRPHTNVEVRRTPTSKTGPAARQKQGYPKYRVSGDLLVKTGLSRNARQEYEHTLHKTDFDAMISLLADFSSSKTEFAVEEIQSRLHFPSYQIYTILALLKARDILFVPKRGLYSFRTPRAFLAESQDLWEELRSHD